MTQFDAYVQARLPDIYTILDYKLQPFSINHFQTLYRFGCEISADRLTLGDLSDPAACEKMVLDLILGVIVCSRDDKEFLKFLTDEDKFNEEMQTLSAKVMHALKHDPDFNVFYRVKMFQQYMTNGVVKQPYVTEDNNCPLSQAHWTQGLLQTLMSEIGYSYDKAINMPIAQAMNDYYKCLEKNGQATALSNEYLAQIKEREEAQNVQHANG